MKKIVVIIDTLFIGGAQKNLINYLSYLAGKNYDITLISIKKSNQYEIPSNIKVIEIIEANKSIMGNFFYILQEITIKSKNADLIIGFMDFIANYIAYLVSQLLHIPLLLSSRIYLEKHIKQLNDLEYINYKITQAIYANSPIIVQSKFIKNELKEFLSINNKNIYILPNYIDKAKVKKSKLPIFKTKTKVFIVVARLIKQKRIDIIIRAFKKLNATEVNLLIVGDGPEESSLKQLVKKLNLLKNVFFKKELKNTLSLIKSSHALILASESEGFSNVLLEAMSQKTLTIASDIEANKEIIKYKKNGLLFKVNNIDDLKLKMSYSLEEVKHYNSMITNGYKTLNKYNKTNTLKKLEAIIAERIK